MFWELEKKVRTLIETISEKEKMRNTKVKFHLVNIQKILAHLAARTAHTAQKEKE